MAFENLPGIFSTLIDGSLQIASVNSNPVVVVLGTAARGQTDNLYAVDSVSTAAALYGRLDGTLVRGLYEAVAGGAENIRLMRIGASPATLSNIGGGVTIETVEKDDNAGSNYLVFWEDSTKRLRVWRASDSLLVYDNNPAYPSAAVDENEVSVSGTATSGTDIGSLSVPLTLAAASGVGSAVYVAGSDGILLSRMEMYEKLFEAYKLLENEDIDIVVPRNVYLDDTNIQDMTTAEVSTFNISAPWAAASVYPTPGTSFDGLGKLFAQEYQGKWYYWWDMDRDGVAEIYPTGKQTTDMYSVSITASDFHEVSFAYQLADFCYRQSEDNAEMIGVIGALPPNSWSLKDVSTWIGKEPTYTEDSAGNLVVTANGSGLLGNKWMAGRLGNVNGLPGLAIGGIDALAYGGFIATDTGWIDGEQLIDRNDHVVDIGKYLSVVPAQAIMSNPASNGAYAASGAAVYAGFVSALPANSAPTNKVQPGIRLPFRVSVSKLDTLAGHGYVMFQAKSKGTVVADAPTGSRPDSDYRRLTTIRIVKASIDAVRAAAEPFLGEPITGARLAALETAIKNVLVKLQKGEYLNRFDVAVTSTSVQQVQGKADVELLLVPAFELRQITCHVALAAQ